MKVKLLFLLKLLVISFVLFVFQGWIEKGYQIILLLVLSILLPPNQNAVSLDYISYLRLIPFLALMLATPKIKPSRRLSVILISFSVFVIIDVVIIIAWGSFPTAQSTTAHFISSHVWKTTGQWILPFFFWFIAVYKDIGELFATEESGF